jgi:hypothetical protein
MPHMECLYRDCKEEGLHEHACVAVSGRCLASLLHNHLLGVAIREFQETIIHLERYIEKAVVGSSP